MSLNPIFSENLLSHHLSDFILSSVTNIRGITILIRDLIEEFESGKIESLKEEEIKTRFVNEFFGDILGFNYGNSNKWLLREEKKSTVDATKPDAALGYFYVNAINDDVRAVIEIKDAKTDLDEKQKRAIKQTTVEQAFSYASKAGGKCKWVIVSNIKEIRFYPSLDRSKCQVFFLKDLQNEYKLKELLFLFHKDRFIKESEKSSTDKLIERAKAIKVINDKPIHIIDKLYLSLKRFEGFGFVNPNYITTIFPFNIQDEHVWQYHNMNLFTINREIYELLEGVNIVNNEIVFTDDFKAEIATKNIIEAKHKIEWSFTFLNHSLINEISAIKDYKQIAARNTRTIGFSVRHSFHFAEGKDGITKSIQMIENKKCDCISCNYRTLDFNKFLIKLKSAEGNEAFNTAEYAFGNYLAATNNFKTTYKILKEIEKEIKGKQHKAVEYFLTKMNIKFLHNLALDYGFEDKTTIINDIKSVDLDKVLYNEIEFDVDNDVKKYLIDVKEDVLIYKIQDEIEEITSKIDELKHLYENGGIQHSGPDLPHKLLLAYNFLYLHINANYIIYDTFIRYKVLTEKVFNGLITSYHIPDFGIKSFNEFILTEAIIHISPTSLQKILKIEDNLKVDNGCTENLLIKLNNFTSSVFEDGLFTEPYKNALLSEQLINYKFRDRFTNIFSNLFTILSRLEISKENLKKNILPLIKFLKTENVLSWSDLKEFSNFILKKGDLFEVKDLFEILKIAISKHKYNNTKYTDLIDAISRSLIKYHPEYKIDNEKIVRTAILNSLSENGSSGDFNHLVFLSSICNTNCKQILFEAFEKGLDHNFCSNFYELLIRNTDYSHKSKNYFQLYSEEANIGKGWAYKFGELKLTNFKFTNYIYTLYKLKIDLERKELSVFTDLNNFETWLLNPFTFDYQKFDAIWLTDINSPIILNAIKNIASIKLAIDNELNREFNSTLAEIKYKYF